MKILSFESFIKECLHTEIFDNIESENKKENKSENISSIKELPNGIYYGYFYDWIFELEDGSKYEMEYGIRRSKRLTPLEKYELIDGNLILIGTDI